MMQKHNNKFSIRQRLNSFKYAINGLNVLWMEEHQFRIHFVAALLAIVLGFFLNISTTEWLFIIVIIALVFAAEIINSAIENLADLVMLERNDKIAKVKDLAAAAVLVLAMAAVVIGLLIFVPKIVSLLV